MTFYQENADTITFTFSAAGILLAFLFRVAQDYRHKICFDYESKRNVAISILQDRFVQRITAHIEEVDKERESGDTELSQIYKRPGQINLIKNVSLCGEDISRIKRYFRHLDLISKWTVILVWLSFIFSLGPVINIWVAIQDVLVVRIWFVTFTLALLSWVFLFSVALYADGRFLSLANSIIEPMQDES